MDKLKDIEPWLDTLEDPDTFIEWFNEQQRKAWHQGFCRGEVSGSREIPINPYTENPY